MGDSRGNSDHIPILLRAKIINWGPIPFRALNFWLENDDFVSWLKEKMNEYNVEPGQSLQSWRTIRKLIKQWSRENKIDITKHISSLEEKLASADKQGTIINIKLQISEELRKAYRDRESMIKKKSRLKWDLEGDNNTKFFHRTVQHRRRKNSIHGVLNNGCWITNPNEVKEIFIQYFENQF